VCSVCLVLLASPGISSGDEQPAGLGGQSDPGCERSQSGAEINCHDESAGATAGSSAPATPAPLSSETRYVAYDSLVTGPDGSPCVTTAWRPEGGISSNEAPSHVPEGGPTVGTEDNSNLYYTYAPCPDQPAPPPGAQESPESIAARYWETIPLPRPDPYIAPGWAITGKLAYLETNGELSHTYTNNTVSGPLEIHAVGSYYVDWGDGESSGPYTREGRPWPDGEITHEYVWAKHYDIVLTERWTATWALAGRHGTLRELHTTGRINDFAARQLQAVIR
jgi:hypothetical protein